MSNEIIVLILSFRTLYCRIINVCVFFIFQNSSKWHWCSWNRLSKSICLRISNDSSISSSWSFHNLLISWFSNSLKTRVLFFLASNSMTSSTRSSRWLYLSFFWSTICSLVSSFSFLLQSTFSHSKLFVEMRQYLSS